MGEIFAEALRIVERSLLSIVAIFVATIAIGITQQAYSSDAAPRTVDFHVNHYGAAVASTPR